MAYGYIHGQCTTACIWANTAWNLPKIVHGILYHKLSTNMLSRRFTGCFKCHFQIFVNLEFFFIMASVPYYGIYGENLQGFSPDFSVITWNFFKPFTLEIGLINSYKMPPHLPCYLIRALRYLSGNIRKIVNSPYWPSGRHSFLLCKWGSDIMHS